MKNVITRERADLIDILNMLQTDGTNHRLIEKEGEKQTFNSKACLMEWWMLTMSLGVTSVVRPHFLYLPLMIATPSWKFPWELP